MDIKGVLCNFDEILSDVDESSMLLVSIFSPVSRIILKKNPTACAVVVAAFWSAISRFCKRIYSGCLSVSHHPYPNRMRGSWPIQQAHRQYLSILITFDRELTHQHKTESMRVCTSLCVCVRHLSHVAVLWNCLVCESTLCVLFKKKIYKMY